ncbi:alpha/beta fold hydrolase [Desulfomonile tiedjei]|uniref:Putative hydrolase or acyltransferase of alpha/beta superfamily n=1 Tax=Desulfomonile tiedjei (strain ATCC 49306 / DSM 6799 / DCB-1) TaxID=706587 RepID=I4C065_DESTA|nr:alpha/beta hydrolase [Desulfomonile tiedjei]AFM22956.1 putative hydrolase or acyltransferase of alpha/beta superfamily [Desulfomonile tiedjei DSM 6799]
MPFAEIRGRQIYYEIHGQGPTVVLLHHGFSSLNMWKGVYPALVEAGYRVVLYDRRGYGRSERGPDFEDFYLSGTFCQENCQDLKQLSHELNLGRFHMVGQCEGGVIAVHYAADFPDQVVSITTSSTLCYSHVTMAEFNAAKFPKAFHELDAQVRDKLLLWIGEEHAESLYEMARTKGGAYGSDKFDIRPLLPLVQCPALVLYPDRSALFEVEQAVTFYRSLKNGELAVLPKCGHNTYDQQPELYIRHVLDFLNRVTYENANLMDFSMTCLAPSPPQR